jgi:hypothetical protein
VVLQVFADCLMTGAQPVEALAWRRAFGGRHPLPGRATAMLLTQLGSVRDIALLGDKLAACAAFAGAGIRTTPIRAHLARGSMPRPAALPETGGWLFLKPRHGSAARGTLAIARDGANWRDSNGATLDDAVLSDRLAVLAQADELLVQDRLESHPDLVALAGTDVAPVLRVTTARMPGAAPFVHAASLGIFVPGERPRNYLHGQMHVPLGLDDSRMRPGFWLGAPAIRHHRAPWNGAPIAGRPLPALSEALESALAAMALVPGLPLVSWDMILSTQGPVLLEGNAAGDFLLVALAGDGASHLGSSIAQILLAWARARSADESSVDMMAW